jgi:hypothetical protein
MTYEENVKELAGKLDEIEIRLNAIIRAGAGYGLIFHYDVVDTNSPTTVKHIVPTPNFSFELRKRVDP